MNIDAVVDHDNGDDDDEFDDDGDEDDIPIELVQQFLDGEEGMVDIPTEADGYFELNLQESATQRNVSNILNRVLSNRFLAVSLEISGTQQQQTNNNNVNNNDAATMEHVQALFGYCLEQLLSKLSQIRASFPEYSRLYFKNVSTIDLSQAQIILKIVKRFSTLSRNIQDLELATTKISIDALAFLCHHTTLREARASNNMILASVNLSDCKISDTTLPILITKTTDSEDFIDPVINIQVQHSVDLDLNMATELSQFCTTLQEKTKIEIHSITFTESFFTVDAFDYLHQQVFGRNKSERKRIPIPRMECQNCGLGTSTAPVLMNALFSTSPSVCNIHRFPTFAINEQGKLSTGQQSMLETLGKVKLGILNFNQSRIPVPGLEGLLAPIREYLEQDKEKATSFGLSTVGFIHCTFYSTATNNGGMIVEHQVIPRIFLSFDDNVITIEPSSPSAILHRPNSPLLPIKTVFDLLEVSPSFHRMKELDITFYPIRNAGFEIMSKYLIKDTFQSFCKISKIGLNCCDVTDEEGFHHLVTALKSNTKVTSITLVDNGTITESGLKSLLQVLQNDNTTLAYFELESGRDEDIDLLVDPDDEDDYVEYDEILLNQIDFFTELNKFGRANLLQMEFFRASLLPFILNKAKDNPSLIHWILVAFPHALAPQ